MITASIIQGSAIGPASYVVNAADLRPVTTGNDIIKYADDTYLIIPASNANSQSAELANVELWSQANNIPLNRAKSVEAIFVDPRRKTYISEPALIDGINRAASLTVLGVTVTCSFSVSEHVSSVLRSCARALYALLRVLRSHGLSSDNLRIVFRAVVVARLTYASSAWVGFTSASDRQRINAFLGRCHRAGLCENDNLLFANFCSSATKSCSTEFFRTMSIFIYYFTRSFSCLPEL
jgi:hypothetical protein